MTKAYSPIGHSDSLILSFKMWISLSNLIKTNAIKEDIHKLAALEHIISSAFRGENFVFADRKTLQELIALPLSLPSIATLKHILLRHSEFSSLESALKYKVSVSESNNKPKRISKHEWEVPLLHFSNRAVTSAQVIGENASDAEALIHSAKQALKKDKINLAKVALTPSNGGGSDTPNTIIPIKEQQNTFLLIVTDTDKSHPNAQQSLTSSRCEEISQNSDWTIEHIALECFEIENLLPTNLVIDSIEESDAKYELSERLTYYKNTAFQQPAIFKWIDTKEGVKVWRARDNNKNNQEQSYWKQSEKAIGKCFQLQAACTKSNECPKNAQNECQCFHFPSLGSDTLDRFVNYCNRLSVQKASERAATSANGTDWFELGRRIASWGIAPERIRA